MSVESQAETLRQEQIQMVVQALPSQTRTPNAKPVFQEITEILQAQSQNPPYITIVHAVPQDVAMEQVPASPPSTPNQINTTDSYFDNQTIFTHAAPVPNYHPVSKSSNPINLRPTGIITAPSSIHVATLERYIPPTTGREVSDFFSVTQRKSYLCDRLAELSSQNGTLLLVYPTSTGAQTFAKKYVGPVIDPLLRRFCGLNDMSTNAAERLGKMAALQNMMAYETMSSRLATLCHELTSRAPAGRGPSSSYSVIHQEKTEVVLERSTWIEWFVEQETERMKQDLVNYQKDGGKMPSRRLDSATPYSLAREVIQDIRKSTDVAGGVGIELGVFVIRRSVN